MAKFIGGELLSVDGPKKCSARWPYLISKQQVRRTEEWSEEEVRLKLVIWDGSNAINSDSNTIRICPRSALCSDPVGDHCGHVEHSVQRLHEYVVPHPAR